MNLFVCVFALLTILMYNHGSFDDSYDQDDYRTSDDDVEPHQDGRSRLNTNGRVSSLTEASPRLDSASDEERQYITELFDSDTEETEPQILESKTSQDPDPRSRIADQSGYDYDSTRDDTAMIEEAEIVRQTSNFSNTSMDTKRQKLNPANVTIAKQQSSSDQWSLTKTGKFTTLQHNRLSYLKVTVTSNRVNKAMEKLNPTSIWNVMQNEATCECQQHCNTNTLGFKSILLNRLKLFGDSNLNTEQLVVQKAVELLKVSNPHPSPDAKLVYTTTDKCNNTIKVCGRFWAAIYGCCESKMSKVRSMVKHGSREMVHGNQRNFSKEPKDKDIPVVSKKSTYAHSFWVNFFDDCCQRPTDYIRLYPVNKPFQTIYSEYFLPWFSKLIRRQNPGVSLDELEWVPSFSTFKEARHHKDFKDVKKRPKHYHARCGDCAELNHIRLRGFTNDQHKTEWSIRFKAHEIEARQWHQHEEARKASSRVGMGRTSLVIGYDDTSTLDLPKLTNRDIKNLTMSRLSFIPFNITNYTSGETAYVYTLKNRYPKGANRLCTVLYHYLRKVKFGKHPCRHARTLVLHADNYCENKNNVVFLFASELVARGWFDVVYLEFGPPGHTHNGTDAVHRVHNRVAGNYNSATIGEFQRKWEISWRKDHTTPTAVLNDAHLNWYKRYLPHERRIAGFTNSTHDPQSAKAFRIQWSPKGDGVEVLFKPTVCDPRWLGRDHLPESPGFFMLKQLPPGRPDVIPGNTKVMAKQYIRQMTASAVLRQVVAFAGDVDGRLSIEWLRQCAVSGAVPYTFVNVDEAPRPGELVNGYDSWGPMVKVGVPGRDGLFYVMQDSNNSAEDFWALPEDIQKCVDQDTRDIMLQRQEVLGIPNVRYKEDSPVYARRLQKTALNSSSPSVQSNGSPSRTILASLTEEMKEESLVSTQWGSDFTKCIEEHFAVVHEEFEEGKGGVGVNVYKINDVFGKDEDAGDGEADYFTTKQMFVPSSKGRMTYDPECLKGNWHGTKIKEIKVLGWQVVYYFTKFTKGKKIPSYNKILLLADQHKLELFKPPEQREFASVFDSEESDDADDADDDKVADGDEGDDHDDHEDDEDDHEEDLLSDSASEQSMAGSDGHSSESD